jgi:hypothetical protein
VASVSPLPRSDEERYNTHQAAGSTPCRSRHTSTAACSVLTITSTGSLLPQLLITLQRKVRSAGYFAPKRFIARAHATGQVHELALNPESFPSQTDTEIMQTPCTSGAMSGRRHGAPPRRGCHDREWGRKMKDVGLCPSSTGEPGGRETGQEMPDYVIPGGRFDRACAKLLAGGFKLDWQSTPRPAASRR